MIWREYDAYVMQVTQIGPSACGPTAIINILVSLITMLLSLFLYK